MLYGHTRYTGYPLPPTHTFTKNGGTNYSAEVIGPVSSTGTGHYELLMDGGSPPAPLEDGSGTDWLYVLVP